MFLREFEIENEDNIIALALFGSYNTEAHLKSIEDKNKSKLI
ncbi:hypothetical protein psyc5s11_39130 [Clostridium gelidum]|uniref:Uncharacterized protein n=1 Tax=Clostridium gelidum TaxID=704125 RepID=A0ABM7T767_9CLOT|nr:hypothetical protein [Clostridium gelidum]BCZ47846.1 hypothetical protein psyc5s11_39130 [Clostridium gelidum]